MVSSIKMEPGIEWGLLWLKIKNISGEPLLVRSQAAVDKYFSVHKSTEGITYRDVLYEMDGNYRAYGLPSAMFKRSMVESAKSCDKGSNISRKVSRHIFVLPYGKSLYGEDLVALTCNKPSTYIDTVPMPRQSRRVVYAKIDRWSAILRVKFNTEFFDAADVLTLIQRVGLEGGTCRGRDIKRGFTSGGYDICSKPPPKVEKFYTKMCSVLTKAQIARYRKEKLDGKKATKKTVQKTDNKVRKTTRLSP